MGAIVAVGALIVGAIGSTVAAVTSVVATIAASVTSALAAIGGMVAGTVSAIVGATISGLSAVFGSIGTTIGNAYAVLAPSLSSVWSSLVSYTQIIVGGMKAFLEAIHFATILKVHNLAMIFSKDYQEMIIKIYAELGKVSEALGLGTHFLSLIMRDARNIVLDVSSLMGRSYDLGEVQWLTTMNDYLKEFAKKADLYENNPGQLVSDLAQLIDKPAIDAKAGFQRSFIQIVDNVVNVADDTAGKLVDLREHVSDAIKHLPKSISRDIFEKVDPFFQKVDDFFEYEYKPTSDKLRSALDVITNTQRRQTDQLHDVVTKILNPGDILANIDGLSDLERIRQENIVADIATRAQGREIEEVNEAISRGYAGLDKIFEIAKTVKEKPPYHVEEYEGPLTPAFVLPTPGKTWFVGDF
jgi:hypothetical protein